MLVATRDLDLLEVPWLPVVYLDGSQGEVGLRECLRQAHRLREVVDPSPLVAFGLHRFLAAVVHHYLALADEDDWAEQWDAGRFDDRFLAAVEDGCQGWLRLFDPERPFYQSGDIPLEGKPAEPLKTVGYLCPEESTGTNVVHFSHPGDDRHAFCPACCARALTTGAPFATAGGAGIKPSLNGVPPVYVLPKGPNLYATLLLNYVTPLFRPAVAETPDPGPLWTEDGVVIAPRDERSRVGFVESLTWPPRRVRLFPGEGGTCSRCGRPSQTLVRQMVYAQGRSRQKGLPPWEDPWAAYAERRDAGKGQSEMVVVRPREDKATWRDFPTLFLSHEQGRWRRPAVLQQMDTFVKREALPTATPAHYETFSLRTDGKGKFFEWRADLFDFPVALLRPGTAPAAVEAAIKAADEVADLLRRALRELHPIASRPSSNPEATRAALAGLIAEARRRYWCGLELPFRRMIADGRLLGGLAQQAAWTQDWRRTLEASAREAFEPALDWADGDAAALRRREKARARFYGGLAHLRGAQENEGG
ncbi:MAG: type I-E CRISPR-associated protein Cse1/CasA [Chloroflexota bacterium]